MVYAFFWVIPRRLNFICRYFGTLCLFHLHGQVGMKKFTIPTCLWRWNRQSVPKRRHIKYRRRGITQKKAYSIQNTAKVRNQEKFSNGLEHSCAHVMSLECQHVCCLSFYGWKICAYESTVNSLPFCLLARKQYLFEVMTRELTWWTEILHSKKHLMSCRSHCDMCSQITQAT